jgi:hypothetical protein
LEEEKTGNFQKHAFLLLSETLVLRNSSSRSARFHLTTSTRKNWKLLFEQNQSGQQLLFWKNKNKRFLRKTVLLFFQRFSGLANWAAEEEKHVFFQRDYLSSFSNKPQVCLAVRRRKICHDCLLFERLENS